MSAKRMGVGIIGLSAQGGWAATAHVPALRALADRFEIMALSASSEQSARKAAQVHDVSNAYGSPMDLASDPGVDLVVVTVKVPQHAELVETALAAGKHVLCEWPLGRDLTEAEALDFHARAAGVRTFVGLQARSAPAVRYVRDLVRDGFVGELLSTTLIGCGGWPWGGKTSAATAYTSDRNTGATMLTIPFGHTIDALEWSLGEISEVRATLATRRRQVLVDDEDRVIIATGPDQIALTATLSSGAILAAHYRGADARATPFLWEINGTDGDLRIEGVTGHLQYGFVSITGGRAGAEMAAMTVPDAYRTVDLEPSSLACGVAHAYAGIFEDLTTGSKTIPDFADAVRTHRLIAAIEQAAAD